MVTSNLVLTSKGDITAVLRAILAMILRAKLGQPTFGKGHLPPTRKGVKGAREARAAAGAEELTRASKEIRARGRRKGISLRFLATIGHEEMVSASMQTPANIVMMGQKGIKTKLQERRLLERRCPLPKR